MLSSGVERDPNFPYWFSAVRSAHRARPGPGRACVPSPDQRPCRAHSNRTPDARKGCTRKDTFHLVTACLSGGKGIGPAVARDPPRVFATFTAPSFGPSTTGPLAVGAAAVGGTRRTPPLGTPLEPDRYDSRAAVLWNAHAGALWALRIRYASTNDFRFLWAAPGVARALRFLSALGLRIVRCQSVLWATPVGKCFGGSHLETHERPYVSLLRDD
ncbi:replication initiator [Streptomyces sp. NPDC001091]